MNEVQRLFALEQELRARLEQMKDPGSEEARATRLQLAETIFARLKLIRDGGA